MRSDRSTPAREGQSGPRSASCSSEQFSSARRSQRQSALALAEMLGQVAAFAQRYVIFASPHQVTACALWVAHTYVCDRFDVSPFLHVGSPEKRSGKTRLLEVLELLVWAPWRVITPSEAVLYRKIAADHPTLLLDEVDTVYGHRRDDAHEPLRALLNAGNRRGVKVARCGGKDKDRLYEFDVFTPRVLAGVGNLPDTVEDRSIPIRLRRRTVREPVERFRFREAATEARPICQALKRWARAAGYALQRARPEIPATLHDRAQELWEPLLAIADLAGGEWPDHARAAAEALHMDGTVQEETPGVVLLRAIREIFEDRKVDRVTTADLIAALSEREDLALPEWWARAVKDGDQRQAGRWLARRLRPFGIEPAKWRDGGETHRGYLWEHLADPCERYAPVVPALSGNGPLHATDATILGNKEPENRFSDATDGLTSQRKPLQDTACGVVASTPPVLKAEMSPVLAEAVRRLDFPVGPRVPVSPEPCRACGGTRFWRRAEGPWICRVCHPTPALDIVAEEWPP